jgi:hypothetical protein
VEDEPCGEEGDDGEDLRAQERRETPGRAGERGERPRRAAREPEGREDREEVRRVDERLAQELAVVVEEDPVRRGEEGCDEGDAAVVRELRHLVDEPHGRGAGESLEEAGSEEARTEELEGEREPPGVERRTESRRRAALRDGPARVDEEALIERRVLEEGARAHLEDPDDAEDEREREDREQRGLLGPEPRGEEALRGRG